ncbi:thiamine diphosphokinase [Gemella bergeri]
MEQITQINIMLDGEKPNSISSGHWCGVDGGAKYLVNKGIKLLIGCGDFDSVNDDERLRIENNSKYYYKKNNEIETDADFALRKIHSICKNIKIINIYGATGKRLDHFFGNILLLNSEKYSKTVMNIVDDNNIIMVAKAGKNIFLPKKEYKYFSIVPLYEHTIMTIKNAKYEAENLELTLTRPNATSNEFFDNKKIELEVDKNCLVIYAKD